MAVGVFHHNKGTRREYKPQVVSQWQRHLRMFTNPVYLMAAIQITFQTSLKTSKHSNKSYGECGQIQF